MEIQRLTVVNIIYESSEIIAAQKEVLKRVMQGFDLVAYSLDDIPKIFDGRIIVQLTKEKK